MCPDNRFESVAFVQDQVILQPSVRAKNFSPSMEDNRCSCREMNLNERLFDLQDRLRISIVASQSIPMGNSEHVNVSIKLLNRPIDLSDSEELQRILLILKLHYKHLNQISDSSLHLEGTSIWQNSSFEFELIVFYKLIPMHYFSKFSKNCTVVVLLDNDADVFEYSTHFPFKIVILFLPVHDLQLKYLCQFVDLEGHSGNEAINNNLVAVDKSQRKTLPNDEQFVVPFDKTSLGLPLTQPYTFCCGKNDSSHPISTKFIGEEEFNSLAYLQHIETSLSIFLHQCTLFPDRKSRNFTLSTQETTFHDSWDFNAHLLDEDGLFNETVGVFEASKCLEQLSIPEAEFIQFLFIVQANYRSNSYHNFRHAIDTAQAAFHLYKQSGYILPPLELFALLVACIGHDVGHPGFNNLFLSQTSSPLSVVYNDVSVLENFHSSSLFQIISNPSCSFTTHFSEKDQKSFRSIIIAAILATDMAFHFNYLEQLDTRLKFLKERPFDMTSSEDKLLFIICILKCADISNVARPLPIASQWTDALLDEFFIQGDQEKIRKIPQCPLNSREISNKAQSQVHFIGDFAIPFYSLVNDLLLEKISHILLLLQNNFSYWKEQLLEESNLQCCTRDEALLSNTCSTRNKAVLSNTCSTTLHFNTKRRLPHLNKDLSIGLQKSANSESQSKSHPIGDSTNDK